jgi:general stress protein 26
MADLVELVERTLRRVPYGFLITPSPDGPDARVVQHEVADDFVLWIGTSVHSRKAHQIGTAGIAATYAVEDREEFAYVAMKGAAALITDVAERRDHWRDGFATFFPAGAEGDDFALVRFEPQRVEVMNFAAGVHPDPFGLVPAVLVHDEDGWASGDAPRFAGPPTA